MFLTGLNALRQGPFFADLRIRAPGGGFEQVSHQRVGLGFIEGGVKRGHAAVRIALKNAAYETGVVATMLPAAAHETATFAALQIGAMTRAAIFPV